MAIHGVILDVIMPRINVKDAYSRIKNKRSDARVLFTSSCPEDLVLQKGMLDAPYSLPAQAFSSQELLARMAVLQPPASQKPATQ